MMKNYMLLGKIVISFQRKGNVYNHYLSSGLKSWEKKGTVRQSLNTGEVMTAVERGRGWN